MVSTGGTRYVKLPWVAPNCWPLGASRRGSVTVGRRPLLEMRSLET